MRPLGAWRSGIAGMSKRDCNTRRRALPAIIGTVCVTLALVTPAQPARCQPHAYAFPTDQAPHLDGVTDDPCWAQAEAIDGLSQFQPTYGDPSSERTEIRVLYDRSHLYIAFDCYVQDADDIEAATTQRDGFFFADDNVGVYLDTFCDRRNCYAFFTNPLGTQRDLRVVNEGLGRSQGFGGDTSWDCTWEVAVARLNDRWSAEMAIPFAELRYDPNGDLWGVNFWRSIQVREEEATWSEVGSRRNNVSSFGVLAGLEVSRLDRGHRLSLIPYSTMSPNQTTGQDFQLDPKIGVDLRYPLTGLTIDVTANPDFAQIEADPAEVNLTDLERRLPEKRPFFLEGGDLYQTPIEIFYTRRVEDLDFGAKVAGRVGGQDIAFVSAQASPFDDEKFAEEGDSNFSALRYQREFGPRLGVGALAVNKYSPRLERANGAGGVDFTLRLPGETNVIGQYAGSWTRNDAGRRDWDTDRAYLLRLERRTATLRTAVDYGAVGPGFEPDAGFMPLIDREGYEAVVGYGRQFAGTVTRLSGEMRHQRLQDSEGRRMNESTAWEALIGFADFFIFTEARRYFHVTDEGQDFTDETVGIFTGWFPPKYARIMVFQNIGYRDGERRWFLNPRITVRPTEVWSLEYSQQRELERIRHNRQWRLTQRVQRLDVRYQLSQRSFLTGSAETTLEDDRRFFVLYGTEYRPKSFLFVVYNEHRRREEGLPITDRALFVKLSYQMGVW